MGFDLYVCGRNTLPKQVQKNKRAIKKLDERVTILESSTGIGDKNFLEIFDVDTDFDNLKEVGIYKNVELLNITYEGYLFVNNVILVTIDNDKITQTARLFSDFEYGSVTQREYIDIIRYFNNDTQSWTLWSTSRSYQEQSLQEQVNQLRVDLNSALGLVSSNYTDLNNKINLRALFKNIDDNDLPSGSYSITLQKNRQYFVTINNADYENYVTFTFFTNPINLNFMDRFDNVIARWDGVNTLTINPNVQLDTEDWKIVISELY